MISEISANLSCWQRRIAMIEKKKSLEEIKLLRVQK
jgi:hypothetical protein